MIVKSDKDDSESSDDVMVLACGEDACQTRILAIVYWIAGKEVEDCIVDNGSTVSIVSSQLYDTIANQAQFKRSKNAI